MDKYQEGIFYIGNLMKYENGKEKIEREQIYLTYDKEDNKFLSFQDALNPSIDLLNEKLTIEERKKIKQKIDSYKYSYTPQKQEGEKYIDESSIQIVEYQIKNKSRT